MAASSPGKDTKCCSYLCRPRVLLTFGVPLLVPSVILVAIAFVSFPDFGVIHICGILLLTLSIVCISFGVLILVCGRLQRKMTPQPEKMPVDEPCVEVPNQELPRVDGKRNRTLRKSSRQRHSNGSVKNKESPRKTRPKRKNSRGVKDAIINNSVKLPTVNEDNEGERLRILSAGGVSRKSLPTLPTEILVDANSSTHTPRTSESRQTSLTRRTSMSVPRVEVWKEQTILSASSELSILSDSSIFFTQDVELTPVEVLEQNARFLSFPVNPPPRSLSLTNMLEGSSSDNTDMDSRRKSGSISDETSFILSDGLAKTQPITNSELEH
ncbi:hypothetical protein LOTGIDRAFT_238986 [Lottia gigantea]|uniref:Uncharacterized protein n=1 Tax=Lottia gigantea TaxID=225164 RepID=V4AUK6_LOTGI|nr:hypothetical protein LOTGIDRAFT_238986 [Lottia gigantea]ESO98625.1 hypothetical protein LOTGIDRAFT_238986 [Lottia gigantea]